VFRRNSPNLVLLTAIENGKLNFIASLGDNFGTPVSHGALYTTSLANTTHLTQNGKGSMSSPIIVVVAGSVVVTYYALKKLASSPWWIIPIYLALVLAWNGYRILVYQRYLNPLSRIPGPKVSDLSAVIILGTLALGRVSSTRAGGAWAGTASMGPGVSQSDRLRHVSWIILYPSSHADIQHHYSAYYK